MDEVEEFERRIKAAFDRITAGLAQAVAPVWTGDEASSGGDAGEIAALREALEAERVANAQLTERVRAIRDKQETVVAALERNVARLSQQLDSQGREMQRLRAANTRLMDANRALSEGGSPDAALSAEVEALRAARASEVAEIDEILSELKPLIGEVA